MQLQQGSGDAWYQLGNFAMAAEKYKAALEAYAQMQNPAASGPQDQVARIQIQLARSLSFGGDREGAFGALIDGLKLNTAANALNGELRDLIASMRLEELKRAELRINSTEISALDPNVYATLYCQIANHEINAGSDLSDAEAQLAKAEAIPDEKLDKSARAFILLLRGESYQAKQMWDQAEPKFKTALSLESSPATEHEVGVFYYSWALLGAQSLEQKNTLLGLAANRVLPILQNSDSDSASQLATYAESLYRNANHRTIPSTDATTRSKYMEILLSHPNNFTVENGLMGVCTDFLHDWDCAFAAATMADKPSLDANDIGTELNIAEIYVQSGHYKSAVDKVQTLQINSNPDYATVADFYTLWASLALGDAPGATNAMQAWRKDVVSFRGRPDRDHDFRWRFDGATYLLSHIDALDPHRAETKFSKQDVSSLQSMISTMGDEKVALPDFPQ
jgi:tetratricopeptide (TPR) repeat protein